MEFNDNTCSSNGLLETIKSLGENIVGCELGVAAGTNLCQILENCDNISKMYAIDPYVSYMDWCGLCTEDRINEVKRDVLLNLSKITQSSKVSFLEMKSNDAVSIITDGELDFIFIDGDHSYERSSEDFINFYPKVKSGGMFSGHDYSLVGVNKSLMEFLERHEYDISSLKLVSNDSWYIIKR
jgi:hypothetical protein